MAELAVPVIVTVCGSEVTGALAAAVKVSVYRFKTPAEKLAVTPVGNPLAVNVAEPVKPFKGASAICVVTDEPGTTLNAAGKAESVKLGVTLAKDP